MGDTGLASTESMVGGQVRAGGTCADDSSSLRELEPHVEVVGGRSSEEPKRESVIAVNGRGVCQ